MSVGFAFGHTQYEDPTAIPFERVSPRDIPDAGNDPGPALDGFTIQRGRIGDAPETQPTRIDLALRNSGGEFSPRNVSGPRYGTLRRGTWTRLYVDTGSGPTPLATANALGFTPTWAGPGMDEQVQVQALGLLNRLARDTAAVSRLRLGFLGDALHYPSAYWPMEDQGNQFASGLVGGVPITAAGVNYAAESSLLGSLPLPKFDATTQLEFPYPGPAGDGTWVWHWYVKYPSSPVSSTRLLEVTISGGTAARITVDGDATTVTVTVYDPAGSVLDTDSSTAVHDLLFGGGWVGVNLFQQFTSVNLLTYQAGAANPALGPTITSGLLPSAGIPSRLVMTAGSLTGAAVGHVGLVLTDAAVPGFTADALGGLGETAGGRINLLASLAGIPHGVIGGTDEPTLGGSPPATVVATMREAENVGNGVLYELRDGRMAYRPIGSRNNRPVDLALSYQDIAGVWPNDDDRDVYNRFTAMQPNGGSFAIAEMVNGPLGSDPNTGIGPRRATIVRNTQFASDLPHQANWALRRAVIDRPRFIVVVNLTAVPSVAAAVLARDIGHRITIAHAPSEHVGPDALDLIIEGEQITYVDRKLLVQWYCEPFEPWREQQLVGTSPSSLDGRLAGADAAALTVGVAPTATSLTFDPAGSRWVVSIVRDDFNRTVASGWGTPDAGPAWTFFSSGTGTAAVSGGAGRITVNPTDAAARADLSVATYTDMDVWMQFTAPVTATADYYTVGAERVADLGVYAHGYRVQALFTTGGNVDVSLVSILDGTLANAPAATTYAPGDVFMARFRIVGSVMWGKVWHANAAEPGWQVTATGTDGLALQGAPGVRCVRNTANTNTNLTVPVDWFFAGSPGTYPDDFPLNARLGGELVTITHLTDSGPNQIATVTRGVNGVVKSHPAGTHIEVEDDLIQAL